MERTEPKRERPGWKPMIIEPDARRRMPRWTILACGVAVLLFSTMVFMLAHLGTWLLVNEPLRRARAIAVAGGGQGWRSIEAGNLYRAGWAPEIWLTRGTPDEKDTELEKLGFAPESEDQFSRQVLLRLGVPDSAIRVIPQEVDNTAAELRAIAAFAGPRSLPVIIVTSKVHTRRVRLIWSAVAPGQTAIVRYKESDAFDPARWWCTTTDALSTFREAFGILNVWAGFPIAPRER